MYILLKLYILLYLLTWTWPEHDLMTLGTFHWAVLRVFTTCCLESPNTSEAVRPQPQFLYLLLAPFLSVLMYGTRVLWNLVKTSLWGQTFNTPSQVSCVFPTESWWLATKIVCVRIYVYFSPGKWIHFYNNKNRNWTYWNYNQLCGGNIKSTRNPIFLSIITHYLHPAHLQHPPCHLFGKHYEKWGLGRDEGLSSPVGYNALFAGVNVTASACCWNQVFHL